MNNKRKTITQKRWQNLNSPLSQKTCNPRKKYSEEEKQLSISRYLVNGESAQHIIAETNIPKSTFYRWIKEYNDSQKQKTKTVNLRVYNAMEGKIQRLKAIIEILKTAECSPRSPLANQIKCRRRIIKKI